MEGFLESGKYSDFTVICGPKEWKVHRAIICPQSEYFSTVCDSSFKEAKNAEIDLSNELPLDIETMLKFLYTGDYTVVQTEEDLPINNLDGDAISALSSLKMAGGGDAGWVDPEDQLFPSSSELSTTQLNAVTSEDIHRQHRHIVMYALGDQYMIEKLKAYAAKKFQDNMPDKWVPAHWQLLDDIEARTLPTDQALRAPIMDLWLKDGLQLFGSEEFRENISRFPAMELEFLRQHATNISAEVSALQGMLRIRVIDLEDRETTLRELNTRRDTVKGSLRDMASSLNKSTKCRHCGERFGGLLEEQSAANNHHVWYLMRCRVCRTKHPPGGVGFGF
ncbi:hypothetical protein AOL_s00004g62 [Orbilia oligospora ATCC 24927]|uniref:BTB domain-containing protein n=1 Tax=Arthrobotrys oligospora (strain ATCC 24927 / CBS 115.81 / DSM 1491) TaxID=756982 RepID=G1WXQ2_ARTOA|nr:hypothetical protein AOL_s00004g62 [Orbilia oligospora ATCC 24927]EGX54029.1 hypothetical protein AOL_s00004g62 [Orbilia oligospora ATCC 24927]